MKRKRRQQISSTKTCLLLLRKVKKESELPLKESVLHLLHHLRHSLDDSIAQPVQISLLSLPSRPFKKILRSRTPRVLRANSVPAEEDRNECFLFH